MSKDKFINEFISIYFSFHLVPFQLKVDQCTMTQSFTGKKLSEWCMQLRLFPKQILCQRYFMFQIIFT